MSRYFEVALGVLVVVLFGIFGYLLIANRQGPGTSTNEYIAIFGKVDGLRVGDDVRIGGVSVGNVSAIDVDPETFEVLASIQVDAAFALTERAQAAVLADGLLGGAFIDLQAGFGPALEVGGYIENTNDAVNLTELLSQAIYNGGGQ